MFLSKEFQPLRQRLRVGAYQFVPVLVTFLSKYIA